METVPCAARSSEQCVRRIPLGKVAARDPDAAAICGRCADDLDIPEPVMTDDVPPVEDRRVPCQHCGDPVLEGGLLEAHEDVCEENPDS